jgi:ubiquinone/menaquinone biosynthesis C-methylase UbiE
VSTLASEQENRNISVFNEDVASNEGYLYTTNTSLSSTLATSRSEQIILEADEFKDKNVLDMGCGDGHYTMRFWDQGHPKSMVAVDGAAKAIEIANKKKGNRPIRFEVADAHSVPYPDNSFDVVLIQSILHHDDRPFDMIAEGFRLAPRIIIHEPNGNNFGLRIIEKTSRYHIEHNEKSYFTGQIRDWVAKAGGKVVSTRFAGFVPMFCPDWMARAMKFAEPIIETVPLLNGLGCSVQLIVAERTVARDTRS